MSWAITTRQQTVVSKVCLGLICTSSYWALNRHDPSNSSETVLLSSLNCFHFPRLSCYFLQHKPKNKNKKISKTRNRKRQPSFSHFAICIMYMQGLGKRYRERERAKILCYAMHRIEYIETGLSTWRILG